MAVTLNRSWRSLVLAPLADGASRRRGSEVYRLISAALIVFFAWVVFTAGSAFDAKVADVVVPPPTAVQWLITGLWAVGTFGLIGLAGVLALVTRRRAMIRDVVVGAVMALLMSWILQWLIPQPPPAPAGSPLAHVDQHFPEPTVGVMIAVALCAMPFLGRGLQRWIKVLIAVSLAATVVHGSGLPTSVVASVAVGWAASAGVHLFFGSPLGIPSPADVAALLGDLGITAAELEPVLESDWGVARYRGRDATGPLNISVYGRDAHDAQLVTKAARFLFYRDSGPTLSLTRLQQVEHEAYLTLLAARSGADVPEVVVAARGGPSGDAVLVTRPPPGTVLDELVAATRQAAPAGAENGAERPASTIAPATEPIAAPAPGGVAVAAAMAGPMAAVAVPGPESRERSGGASSLRAEADRLAVEKEAAERHIAEPPPAIAEAAVEAGYAQVALLRSARIAHGSLSTASMVVDGDQVGLVDLRRSVGAASDEQLDRDVACAMVAMGLAIGATRSVAAATRTLPEGSVAGALPFLQRAALSPALSREIRSRKPLLTALREEGATAAGVEVPKLAEARRVSWINILLVLGTIIGGWALVGVLVDVANSFDTITGAEWGWVVATALLAFTCYPSGAVEVLGSVTDALPYVRTLLLEIANTFVALAGGTMAVLATRVRFFQQQGYNATLAVSSGLLVSTASWITKGAVFVIALPFALGAFNFDQSPTGPGANTVWIIVIVVVAVGILLGILVALPRLRRTVKDKLWPRLADVVDQLRTLAAHPRKLVQIFGGALAIQLAVGLALETSLHAFGNSLPLTTLFVVITMASVLGGVSPVPGGMGIVEAGMILGLSAAGISESHAVAAVFIQRLFTSYLPPIAGWFAMVGLRKREYI